MQEWLGNNNTLMYSTHNKGKSYLTYMNKLVDQYNNTYHHSINKKPINADDSALTEKIKTNLIPLKFKVNDRGYTKNWSREIFITNFVLKTNPWISKIKDLNGEEIAGNFFEKELLLSIL